MPSAPPKFNYIPTVAVYKCSMKDSRGAQPMDHTIVEPRIRKVAWDWASTISNDASIDMEDLLQELRWRYWKYWEEKGKHPPENTIRDWAREAMLSFGYRQVRDEIKTHGVYIPKIETVSLDGGDNDDWY